MTTNWRFSKSLNHFVWCGRIAAWSMSGLVMTTWPAAAHHAAHVGGRVPVVGVGLQVDLRGVREGSQRHELIGGERLGREEIEGARSGIGGDRVEDRQVVAERLARCGRRDHHGIATGAGGPIRGCLVRVRGLDSGTPHRVDDPRVHALRPRCVARRPGLELAVSHDERRDLGAREERGDRLVGIRGWGGQHWHLPDSRARNRTNVRSRTIAQVFESSDPVVTARLSQKHRCRYTGPR